MLFLKFLTRSGARRRMIHQPFLTVFALLDTWVLIQFYGCGHSSLFSTTLEWSDLHGLHKVGIHNISLLASNYNLQCIRIGQNECSHDYVEIFFLDCIGVLRC